MSRNVVTPVAIVVIALSFLLHAYWKSKREVEKLRREYPSISYEKKLNLTIQEIFNPESLRDAANHAFVIFSNSEKATIETTDELTTDTLHLDDVLNVGDSVAKEANSSLILVYKPIDEDSGYKQPFKFQLYEFRGAR